MTASTGVSVVVPTLNRAGFLYFCLQDLLAQEHRPLEILVVDQSDSVPDEVQMLSVAHADLISYHNVAFRGLPIARNYGWQNARYEAIVFVDDDVRCPPNLIGEHLRALMLPNVGAVAGRISERRRATQRSERAGRFHYWTATPERGFDQSGEYDTEHVPGGNFATWRHIVRAVGGFDEQFNVGAALYEETEFSLRLRNHGYRIYYNSRAQLDHLAAPSGGCRVDTIEPYIWALAHNRTLLIRRYLRWYQQPTAFAELLRLGIAHTVHYHQVRVLRVLVDGIAHAISERPTRYKSPVHASE